MKFWSTFCPFTSARPMVYSRDSPVDVATIHGHPNPTSAVLMKLWLTFFACSDWRGRSYRFQRSSIDARVGVGMPQIWLTENYMFS